MENAIEFHRAVAQGNVNGLIKLKRICSKKEISALANRKHSETAATALLTACKAGHYKVVKFLLEECTVNIDETCEGVRLASDSYDEEMTSLHLAVSRGRLNLVELLLSHGAQVNAATKTNKTTPLHIACHKNNIGIVKCLLDHGANIDDTNWCGNTSLMIACKKADIHLVNHLLSANADVHKKSLRNGNTALHKCCKSEYEDIDNIFMALVQHGASINAKNIYGVTPPLQAALKQNTILISKICNTPDLITLKQIIEIREIFGACVLVTSCGDDKETTFRFWVRALMERNSEPPIPKERRDPSIFSFGQQEEFQDEATLRSFYHNEETMMFQAFLVLERVLGFGHPFTTHGVLCGPLTMESCLYALDTQQRINQLLDPHIRKSFRKARLLVSRVRNDGFTPYDRMFIVFSKMFDHLSMGKQYMADHSNSTKSHILLRELTKLLADTLDLASFLALTATNIEGFMDKFRDVLRKLVNLNLRIGSGRQPLHLIMAQMKTIGHNPLVPRNELACLPLIQELLKVGADPNGRDEDGNTPLHLAAMMRSKIKHKQHFEALIASGARTCASNHNGETFLDLLPSGEADDFRMAFCSGEKMELACLASHVVKKNQIPFEMLPAKVVDYVHRH